MVGEKIHIRQERVGSVAAHPGNLQGSRKGKEAEREEQGAQRLYKNLTVDREGLLCRV